MDPNITDMSDLDIVALTRQLDIVKSELFTRKYAAFYGSLLCSMNFYWTPDIGTAATTGIDLMWNPYFFLKLPQKTRITVLMHEIQHTARLHFARMGDRIPKIWNYATDIRINNDLENEGYSFEGIEWCWKDQDFAPGTPEEDIYDTLIAAGKAPPNGAFGVFHPTAEGNSTYPDDGTDMFPTGPSGPMTKDQQAKAVNNVVRAAQQAQHAGAGQMPGNIVTILTQFLAPVVPWEQFIHRFMEELVDGGYTYKKPNRRYTEVYMPSTYEEPGALAHLVYFEDTSGSISDKDALRFNSEFKYVKDTYRPNKMTLVQFDTIIQNVQEYEEEDPFDQVKIYGRGGTDLAPVREYILEHRPTAAIVFSDMECAPMAPLDFEIPILWVVINNRSAKVPFGQIISIR